MVSNPYGDAAKVYRKLGWLGVLPLPAGEKHPPPKDFTGSGRPHPTDDQVAGWIKKQSTGNLALRLAEVPREFLGDRALPQIYAGNNVDGWELIGIDVDDYGEKHGLSELRELEAELGPLPKTAMSSARWDRWNKHRSAIRVFLVPKGYRYMGKAGHAIDIIQKRHRFMVAHPSTNPDANGALYEWRYGDTTSELAELFGFDETDGFEIPILATDDVEVLPVAWFDHLSRGGTIESKDAISALSDDELVDWIKTCRFEDEQCERMTKVLTKHLEILEQSASSHDKLRDAHWELVNLAAEGHAGLFDALNQYHQAWYGHVAENRADTEAIGGEINRSFHGALDKIQPLYDRDGVTQPVPSDTCETKKRVEAGEFDTASWSARFEDDKIAAGDFGGLGPIVGRMEVLPTKSADEYGQHDDGNGQHFVDMYGHNVKFVDGRDSWVIWDGTRWHRDKADRLGALAYRRVRERQESVAWDLMREGELQDDKGLKAAGKSWLAWSKRSGNVAPINAALESASRQYVDNEPVAVPANIFDSRVELLGCANGVLELTREPDIRPPRKEDYVTFNTHTEYIPWRSLANAEGEVLEGWILWNEYLDTFLPDKDLQRYIQKVMGHLMIGENPEKRIVFLYGPHDTGKSTMLGAIKGALGDYYGTIDAALLKPRDLNPGLIRAVPLRVTGMSEADAATMDAATVKRLTGNDAVTAEAKYSNEIFEGQPQFTIVIAANNPPNIRHADEALEERILVLPFSKTIDRASRRYDRQTDIAQHSNVAVLSWLVEGWRMYANEGLGKQPNAIRKLQRDMVSGLNATQTFISEHLLKAKDSEEGRRALQRAEAKAKSKKRAMVPADLEAEWTPTVARVYEIYQRWCNSNGVDAVSRVELTKDIGLGKPFVRKINGKAARCYYGAKIKEFEQSVGGMRVR